jgi:hypothetical protein
VIHNSGKVLHSELDLSKWGAEIVESAKKAGIALRLFGGCGVTLRCQLARDFISRTIGEPRDVDIVGLSHQRKWTARWLNSRDIAWRDGDPMWPYMDREILSTVIEGRRVRVEVFYDRLAFVHIIDVRDDFGMSTPTLTVESLVMSKLQMRRPALRDLGHLAALLIELGDGSEPDGITSCSRIRERAGRDFRTWRDFISTVDLLDQNRGALALTSEEDGLLSMGVGSLMGALMGTRHGPAWWWGRLKATCRIEPPEPELPVSNGA